MKAVKWIVGIVVGLIVLVIALLLIVPNLSISRNTSRRSKNKPSRSQGGLSVLEEICAYPYSLGPL